MTAPDYNPAKAADRGYSTECRCTECADIHAEFIMHFGKWPTKTHDEGQELKRRRADNEASWDRIQGGTK